MHDRETLGGHENEIESCGDNDDNDPPGSKHLRQSKPGSNDCVDTQIVLGERDLKFTWKSTSLFRVEG
jgi:hypothetical protein